MAHDAMKAYGVFPVLGTRGLGVRGQAGQDTGTLLGPI